MTWWWLWDGFVLVSLLLSALESLVEKRALLAVWTMCCCWLAFFRVLSSYGAW